MAQDKSGIDVDNDSLLRNAYNWYNGKPADSLYAKCEYYMGKYYALNDSSEKRFVAFPILSKLQNDKMITIHKVWRWFNHHSLLENMTLILQYSIPMMLISYIIR